MPMDKTQQSRLPAFEAILLATVGVIVIALFCVRAYSSRWVWVDEAEHLHAAWNIAQGQIPFRDFFEHHPPVLWYLLAPLTAGRDRITPGFVLTCRAMTMAVLCFMAISFGRLCRFNLGGRWAAAAAILITIAAPAAFLEVRPDFLALFFSFAGLARLGPGQAINLWRSLIAGLLCGLSATLTQKGFVVIAGAGLWMFGGVAFGSPVERMRRLASLALFTCGAGLPWVALGGYFIAHSAFASFIECVFTVNSHWAREFDVRTSWHNLGTYCLPIYALASIEAIIVVSRIRSELRDLSARSLGTILFVFGVASFFTTPAPYGQSFIFFIVPWSIWLGLGLLRRQAEGNGKVARLSIVILLAMIALVAPYEPPLIAKTLGVWTVALLFGWATCRALRWPILLGMAILVAPALTLVGKTINEARQHAAPASNFEIAIDQNAPPPQPLISWWHIPRPFQPIPMYHWFVHEGVIKTISPAVIEKETLAALQSGRVHVAALSRLELEQMPTLQRYLKDHAQLAAKVDGRFCNELYIVPRDRPTP